jgi:hypothetical protein
MMPQVGGQASRSPQPASDTLDTLTSHDFGGNSRALNAQRSTMNANDEPGLLDDENPFQFDLEGMDFDSKNIKRSEEPQHESMPGRLTLELDAGAMSIELSSSSMDDPAAPNMSATERRTIELRLDEAMTGLPLANTAFNSLADTAELDETSPGAQPRPGTPDRNANAPTAPGQMGPEVTGEFLLDLDDLGDDPRPPRS